MTKVVYLIIGISSLIIAILATMKFYNLKKQKNHYSLLESSPTNLRNKWNEKSNRIAQRSYNVLIKIPGLKKFIFNIRKRLETLSVYDEYTLRRVVIKIIFNIFCIFAFVGVLLLILRPPLLIVFWIFVGLYFTAGILVDHFVYRVEEKLLEQIKEFNNRLRYFYQQTNKMIVESFFESLRFAGLEMKIQAEKIYNILTCLNPEKELSKYEETAPSRYLKTLARHSLMIKEEGDVVTERGSAFLSALSAINVEINTELLQRRKLAYRLKGLSTMAIAPVFFTLPIHLWAIRLFPVMAEFYDSLLGFLTEVLVYSMAVISYTLIRKLRDVSEKQYYREFQKDRWERKLLEKVPFLKIIIRIFKPAPKSKSEYKLKKLLKEANSPLDIDSVALRRTLVATLMLVLLLSGFIYGHYRDKHNALYNANPNSLFAGNLSIDEKQELIKQTEFDRQLILSMQEGKVKTKEQAQSFIQAALGKDYQVNDPKTKEIVDRVIKKYSIVQNAFLKWWEVLVVFILAYSSSFVPILLLHHQKRTRWKDMENEVFQFYILIGILKEFESMSVYKILNWLYSSALIFKEPLQETIQNYDAGPEKALQKLIDTVGFEPFQQIIERLKLSVVRISIQEAFDDIDVEREYFIEQRKEVNERIINSKSTNANYLAWIPLLVLVFIYLIIPIIFISMYKSRDLIMHIQSLN